ncbi:MAG: uroporphyrinogen decarboxylase family protein [candidate division KSB1 bacterium]|nr:uroporphyrinogen decarboxylase family protein [candidate division KSB1 bacterium]MDZ7335899.1 uroporphyrinogen decarboxylase family protein [candidate division KSB1 bacterium]MDZ7357164.1 uroporphyrinogen decarboxylase family protein [candidate division KSB1 bacterium]MDZ7375528.1 uroporphyrinogen decarboxylase family protein [candidate division KSB1 bacterium]MDZ7398572.1 uroporphyrinogen decarboxylase family protein [candidate division KSB1 bacterium]
MTTQERFYRVMHWQKPDRVPNMEFGYWDETIEKWHTQGLPVHVKTNQDVERYLGLEGVEIIPWLPAKNGLCPRFDYRVLEEGADYRVYQNEEGIICQSPKFGETIPRYLKFGIETREDWERYRTEHLDPNFAERIGDVRAAVVEAHAIGMPIRFDAGSLYGVLRNWMGMENLSIAIMTDRDWVEEMMEHLTQLTLQLIEQSLPGIRVDMAWWWEDMCYNRGPLISPKLFQELMVPRYKRVTAALQKYGVDINVLDCDGCIYELVPGWLEAGINCMFPIEALHTDPVLLRQRYGNAILLMGGVDKTALIKGKEAIDRELERIAPLVDQGGYIPMVDHRVPSDVSFENYIYYLEQKQNILQ